METRNSARPRRRFLAAALALAACGGLPAAAQAAPFPERPIT